MPRQADLSKKSLCSGHKYYDHFCRKLNGTTRFSNSSSGEQSVCESLSAIDLANIQRL